MNNKDFDDIETKVKNSNKSLIIIFTTGLLILGGIMTSFYFKQYNKNTIIARILIDKTQRDLIENKCNDLNAFIFKCNNIDTDYLYESTWDSLENYNCLYQQHYYYNKSKYYYDTDNHRKSKSYINSYINMYHLIDESYKEYNPNFNDSIFIINADIKRIADDEYTEMRRQEAKEASEQLDRLNRRLKKEDNIWKASKAYKVYKKYGWCRKDCEKLLKGKVWIGMKYEMLVYMMGKPNIINTSNYGSGNQYQACWSDYTISCYYFNKSHIITAYN